MPSLACKIKPKFDNPIDRLIKFPLEKENIRELLTAEGNLQQLLFWHARQVRKRYQTDTCLLRGVIEISNYCQKNCNYCAMRAGNKTLNRYRMEVGEILAVAEQIAEKGINTFFLQGGQDPKMDSVVLDVIPKIKERFKGNIIICIGERTIETYQRLFSSGADSFILKFETSDACLYHKITQSDLLKRIDCIEKLNEIGFKTGVGNIIGLPGQTIDSVIEDIFLALKMNPDFVSAAPFIPNQSTPFEDHPIGDLNLTLNCMAIYRILLKTCLIPSVSALEKIRKNGQGMGLDAGANVMTINFTPAHYRKRYKIYSKQRFVVSYIHALASAERANLNIKYY